MPYVTLVGDGVTPSAIPAFNDVHHNMIVANYAADGGCLDNDDGRCVVLSLSLSLSPQKESPRAHRPRPTPFPTLPTAARGTRFTTTPASLEATRA